MENNDGQESEWRRFFSQLMLNIPSDPELLKSNFWVVANKIYREASWFQERYQVRVLPKYLSNFFEIPEGDALQPKTLSESKKVISFSLWGKDPKYIFGAIRNADLAIDIYPGWLCRYYYDSTVPFSVIENLDGRDNVELVEMAIPSSIWHGSFWRFFTIGDPSVDVTVCRDVDSMLTVREKAAVDQWLDSGLAFHIMRDHPLHQYPILAGLFGYKGTILDIDWLIENYLYNHGDCGKLSDQYFLEEVIYPFAKYQAYTHDEFYGGESFPTKRVGTEYAGQIFPEPVSVGYNELLRQYLLIQEENKSSVL